MYKVIIAEDEMFVRLGIKMSADWEKLGMQVVADVENGHQALEAYESLKPDIIITDIKMPVMDGLELIRNVRSRDERTRFIILSCLEEFQTVREAIALGVSDYVLKLTMTQEDMENVLKKVAKELSMMDKSLEKKENIPDKQQFEESLRNYLYYRLEMKEPQKEIFMERFSNSGGKLRMVLLEIDHYSKCKEIFHDDYGNILDFSVENILSELLIEKRHVLFSEKNGRFVLILEETSAEDVSFGCFEEILEKIREVLRFYVKTPVSYGISLPGNGYEDLYEMYHQSAQALDAKFFYTLDCNCYFRETIRKECGQMICRKMERLIRQVQKDGDDVKYLAEAQEAFCQHENPMTIRQYFEHAVNVEMCKILLDGEKRYQITGQYIDRIKESHTFDEVLDIYKSCRKYLEKGNDQKGLSKPVKDILSYIHTHYAEDISLDQIARMVVLSRTYVCGLFKKEMGVNLTNYLMNYRIEKAKELMRNTNLRSYEIAEKVGFLDESYFSRTFKKVTGQSPNAYKKGM